MSKTLTLKPRMSEKAYSKSQSGVYVFVVPKGSNKQIVSKAVSAQFNVTVENVNITRIPGKVKRTFFKRGRRVAGRESDTLKAYVKLKSGDSIPVFAAVEQAEEKSKKLEESAEKAAKKGKG